LLNDSLYAIKSLIKSSFDKHVDNETGILLKYLSDELISIDQVVEKCASCP